MTFKPDPKPPKTRRKAKPDETWRFRYRSLPCLIPDCEATPTCFAHHPKPRGLGGGGAQWRYDEGVPLCDRHHKRLDAQGETWALHEETRAQVAELAPAFWESIRRAYGL
jgi:hypothetical protein